MKTFKQYLTEHGKNFTDDEIHEYAQKVRDFYYEYDVTDDNQGIIPSYQALLLHIEFLKTIMTVNHQIKIEYSETDPYSSDIEMINDIHNNKRLKVYTGHSDHPFFEPEENVTFRAVHDYFSHYLPNKKFAASYLPGQILRGNNFSIRGEFEAYEAHQKFSRGAPLIWPALFCEIIGQVCCFYIDGHFPPQKIVDFSELITDFKSLSPNGIVK